MLYWKIIFHCTKNLEISTKVSGTGKLYQILKISTAEEVPFCCAILTDIQSNFNISPKPTCFDFYGMKVLPYISFQLAIYKLDS